MEQQDIRIGRVPLRIVQVVALLLCAFKFVQLARTGVFQDEAYYWMWSQHPALSYFDHPPLTAWSLWLSSSVFGWTYFALRLPVVLSVMADIGALYLIARRAGGSEWPSYFWLTLLLFFVTPIYWLMTSLNLPDHLLLTGCLYTIYFFFGFFTDRSAGLSGRNRDLYLGALWLGLSALAKYNAAFLALGIALYILAAHRGLLREGRLYLAALLTLLLQLPVLIWNATEGFASWEFILHDRHAGLKVNTDGVLGFGFGMFILISPILLWPMLKFIFGWKAIPGSGFARLTFVLSTALFFVLSFTTAVLPHWNLVAYTALLPFLVVTMRPRLLIVLQVLWGVTYAAATFTNYAITPISDVERWRDEATGWAYGWGPVVAAVQQARTDHKVGFIAAPDYTTAALLGFHLEDRDVTSLNPVRDEYDFWFDPQAHAGEDAILFDDTWRPLNGAITGHFKSVTPLTSIDVVVSGRLLDTHRLYLATDFTP